MPSPVVIAKTVLEAIASNPQLKGRLGLLAYSGFLCIWTTLALPTTPLEMFAGFTFSLTGSTIAGLVGKTCGSVLAFIIGRSLLGPCTRLIRWMRGKPLDVAEPERPSGLGAKLEEALRKRPMQTIGMIRVAPLPGGVKNFGLSLFPSSVVPLPTFIVVTLVMNAPFSLAWSLAGSSASNLQEAMSGGGESAKKQKQLLGQLTAMLMLLGAVAAFSKRMGVSELIAADKAGAPAGADSTAAPSADAQPSKSSPSKSTPSKPTPSKPRAAAKSPARPQARSPARAAKSPAKSPARATRRTVSTRR